MISYEHTLAVVPVRDIATARDWYTKLFGREPDNNPMPVLVEWQVTTDGWVQVSEDASRAGHGVANLAVADLEEAIGDLGRRGLSPGAIVDASKGVRLSELVDPDGNTITLIGGFRVDY